MKKFLGLVLCSSAILSLTNTMADPSYVYGGIAVTQRIVDTYDGLKKKLPGAILYQVAEDSNGGTLLPGSVCNEGNYLQPTGNIYFYKGGSDNAGYQCPLNVYRIIIKLDVYNQQVDITDNGIKQGQPAQDDNSYLTGAGCSGTIDYDSSTHKLSYTGNGTDSCTAEVSYIN